MNVAIIDIKDLEDVIKLTSNEISLVYRVGERYMGNLNANTVKCQETHRDAEGKRRRPYDDRGRLKERHLHAREYLEPSKAGGDGERFSAREGAWVLLAHLNYRLWPPEM